MGKGKLQKFAEMKTFPNVFQFPFSAIGDAPFAMAGHWREQCFHNDHPIVLELGCGKGEYAVGLAKANPRDSYIGVDIKGARMWTGATEALRQGIANVAFLRSEIENLPRLFAPGEVETIWLTFSDPQMKRAQKRMTSTYFLERYRRVMKDGGVVNVKTDSNFLFTYTKYVVEVNHLPLLHCCGDVYAAPAGALPPEVSGLQTYYESQWRGRGIPIKFISFTLPHSGVLREPGVEIPLDTYRSYSRQKRSGLEASR